MGGSLPWFAVGAGLIVGVVGLDRLALWMERRGWIYYRRRSAAGTTSSSALLGMHSLLEPDKKHMVEMWQRDQIMGEDQETGDPPS